jgi:Trypsin-co-occurring domain 1
MMSESIPSGEANVSGQTPDLPMPKFYIQIDRDIPGGIKPQFNMEKFVNATSEQLHQIGAVVRTASQWFTDEIQVMEHRPRSFCLEFGIDVGAEGGIPFITKGTIEANFKVSIEWSDKE